jgi:hypothetical protein
MMFKPTLFHSNIVVESVAPDRCAGLVGNYQAKVLFKQADSDAKVESTVLQNRMHLSQQKFFDLLGMHICISFLYYHNSIIVTLLGWNSAVFVTLGWNQALYFFDFRFIIAHLILTLLSVSPSYSTGGLFHFKKDHTAYSIAAKDYDAMPLFISSKENRLLNEFVLYLLEDHYTSQSLGAIKFTSADPALVKETVEPTRVCLPFDSRNDNHPRDASDKGLLAVARCLHSCLPSHRSVL